MEEWEGTGGLRWGDWTTLVTSHFSISIFPSHFSSVVHRFRRLPVRFVPSLIVLT